MFLSTNNLKQYKTAAMTTGFGALKLFGSWLDVPVKSTITFLLFSIFVILTLIIASLSVLRVKFEFLRFFIAAVTLFSAFRLINLI